MRFKSNALWTFQVEAEGVITGQQTGELPTQVQFDITDPRDVQPSVRDCSSGFRVRVYVSDPGDVQPSVRHCSSGFRVRF